MSGLQSMSAQKLKTHKLRRGMFKVVNAYGGQTGFFVPSPLLTDPVEEAKKAIVIKMGRPKRKATS